MDSTRERALVTLERSLKTTRVKMKVTILLKALLLSALSTAVAYGIVNVSLIGFRYLCWIVDQNLPDRGHLTSIVLGVAGLLYYLLFVLVLPPAVIAGAVSFALPNRHDESHLKIVILTTVPFYLLYCVLFFGAQSRYFSSPIILWGSLLLLIIGLVNAGKEIMRG